jgi:DNA-binding NtrC family response regulator
MRSPILLVDDDEFARCFARTVLERAGYQVHEAGDIAGALAVAGALTPVAVVTDWNLPDGNGGELARILHEISEALPIVLITGEPDAAELLPRESIDEFTSIVHKPFSPSALERSVRAAIQQIPYFAVGS